MHGNIQLGFEEYVHPLLASLPMDKKTLEISPGRRNSVTEVARGKGISIPAENHWVANMDNIGAGNVIRMNGENEILAPDGTFDAVWSTCVVEHVSEPWLWIKEQARVVKRGGYVIVIGPVTWEHHRVSSPTGKRDCWRIMPDGMKVLLKYAGLNIILAKLFSFGQDTSFEYQSNRGSAIDCIGIGKKR